MATNNWIEIGGGGGGTALSVGTFDSLPAAANGATISGASIYFQSADATHPGMVNTGSQTFGGAKTLTIAAATSSTTHPASAGIIRLANTDAINWRNAGNSADIGINLDASNILQVSGAMTIAGILTLSTGEVVTTGGITVSGGGVAATGASSVTGSADAVQLTVKGNGTQTNNTLVVTDSSNAVQFSVSNGGVASATTSFKGPDGAAATPSHTFTSDATAGMYLTAGSGTSKALNFSAHSTQFIILDHNTGNGNPYIGTQAAVRHIDGTSGAPSITFSNEGGTGLARLAGSSMSMVVQGTETIRSTTALLTLKSAVQLGASATTPTHVINSAVNTAGTGAGTLTNVPGTSAGGNPAGYIAVTINGTASFIPYWQ